MKKIIQITVEPRMSSLNTYNSSEITYIGSDDCYMWALTEDGEIYFAQEDPHELKLVFSKVKVEFADE